MSVQPVVVPSCGDKLAASPSFRYQARCGKAKEKKAHAVSDIHLNPAKQLAFTSHSSKQYRLSPIYQESGKQSFSEYGVTTIKSDFCC